MPQELSEKKRVVVFLRHFSPAFKAGGPIRTIANLIHKLKDTIEFRIITSDRDVGDDAPFPRAPLDRWTEHDGASVLYLSRHKEGLRRFRQLLYRTEHDCIYLNSFFCPRFTIPILLLRRAGLIPAKPLVLAPRGEFANGALALGRRKKGAYLLLAKAVGLYSGIRWQASSEYELQDIRKVIGADVETMVAPNMTADMTACNTFRGSPDSRQVTKRAGALRLVFLSRVSPMKNLAGALILLRDLQGEVRFDIFGPVDDERYWERCQAVINALPRNVTVTYRGPIEHEQVRHTFAKRHLMFLPTLGENFGHVIHEALSAGCPVLISDRTPWRNLQREGVGWDLPLEETGRFVDVLQRCIAMPAEEHRSMSERARAFAERWAVDSSHLAHNVALFDFSDK